jgi:uncharacterized protein YbcV (DUF1398 family)
MNAQTRALIEEAFTGSGEARLHFGQVLGLLTEAGVESYAVDYRSRRTTYYLRSGETLDLDTPMPELAIPETFDVDAIKAAILGSQRGVVKYPEFKRLSREAGCIGYTVWIAGRHVTYFGRQGQTHVERFPT